MDETSTQLHPHLEVYMKEHNKNHSWVILTEDQQWNSGIHITKNSTIFHLPNLTRIEIFWGKDDHLPRLKADLLEHLFIKDDIFEATAKFPLMGKTIGMIVNYCEHHNIYYGYQSRNNSPWNGVSLERNRTNVCIILIGKKEPTTVK